MGTSKGQVLWLRSRGGSGAGGGGLAEGASQAAVGQAGLRAPAMEGEGDEKSAWGGEKRGNKSLVDAVQNL